jgi:glycosyltransferase involved in cell wall biosynthesis
MIEKKQPVVSVCMITYNHENYIRQAIEGVLMQKTNFPIELIIGEDCSTDDTLQICLKYQHNHADIIKILHSNSNLGVIANFNSVLNQAKTKYIALCEGDDYWIDPYKLQKQVDYLTNNNKKVLIHTNGFWNKRNKITPWNEWTIKEGNVEETFYYGNIVRTCTALFRSEYIDEFLSIWTNSKCKIIGDWALFAFYATKGEFGYIADKTSVYRLNSNSVTSKKNSNKYFSYELDVIEMKRFLRDYIFVNKLNTIYSEQTLIGDINHAYMKKCFNDYSYNQAIKILQNDNLNSKTKKLHVYLTNRIVFYASATIRKVLHCIK